MCAAAIEEGEFRGLDSAVIKNGHMRAEFLPGYGSKLASLRDLRSEKEFLFQPPEDRELSPPGYGAKFARYDASGFDEMFPTIDASFYPAGKWSGERLPDHGELWSISWDMNTRTGKGKACIEFSAESKIFPCRLQKRLSLHGSQLQIDYSLHNRGDEKIEFIWAAHPLFKANPNMEIILPGDVSSVINVEDSNPHLGCWGEVHSYPRTQSLLTGEPLDLSSVPGPDRMSIMKFYVQEKLKNGFCALRYPEEKLLLEFTFPEDRVPYLGVWKSLGGFRGDYNLALEPCTGAFDDLYLAYRTGRSASVKPGSIYEWWLNFSVKNNDVRKK